MARTGKIGISVKATTGYNDEILSSPNRRYKRFLLYFFRDIVDTTVQHLPKLNTHLIEEYKARKIYQLRKQRDLAGRSKRYYSLERHSDETPLTFLNIDVCNLCRYIRTFPMHGLGFYSSRPCSGNV